MIAAILLRALRFYTASRLLLFGDAVSINNAMFEETLSLLQLLDRSTRIAFSNVQNLSLPSSGVRQILESKKASSAALILMSCMPAHTLAELLSTSSTSVGTLNSSCPELYPLIQLCAQARTAIDQGDSLRYVRLVKLSCSDNLSLMHLMRSCQLPLGLNIQEYKESSKLDHEEVCMDADPTVSLLLLAGWHELILRSLRTLCSASMPGNVLFLSALVRSDLKNDILMMTHMQVRGCRLPPYRVCLSGKMCL
jgi:hypothetical protein